MHEKRPWREPCAERGFAPDGRFCVLPRHERLFKEDKQAFKIRTPVSAGFPAAGALLFYGGVMTEYKTLQRAAEAVFVEKKSRFIGAAAPVQTVEEAQAFLQDIRRRHFDARHHVSAYVLRGGVQHCSDDGEPQGTAGVPTLNVLLKAGLSDAVVVVTRYFGGVLLGTGGLVRAYSHTAALAVEAAGIAVMRPCLTLSLRCTYAQYGRVAALLPEMGAFLDGEDFSDAVEISFHLPGEKRDALQKALADATSGQVVPRVLGEAYFALPAGKCE